ncbi:MAG TPA: Maf family protein [Chloroflexota bacterium]
MPLQIVLASQSPQRLALMNRLGLDVVVQPSDVDEATIAVPADPRQQVRLLAQAKAEAVMRRYPQHIVLGADTLVDLDGSVLGKPGNPDVATAMLRRLSGRRHLVHTGLALVLPEARQSGGITRMQAAIVSSAVTLHLLNDANIAAYVQTGEPLNKAGAYGIQGLGSQLVATLSGCFTNVVGLPLCAVAELLTAASGQAVLCPADSSCRLAGGCGCHCQAR